MKTIFYCVVAWFEYLIKHPKAALVWVGLIILPYLLWYGGFTRMPIMQDGIQNAPLTVATIMFLWFCHENFGFFKTKPSESDAPRMHRHPTDDHA